MISISRTPRAAALFAATSAIALLALAGNAHASQTIDGTTVTVPGTHPSPWVVDNGLFLGTSGAGTLDVNSGGVVNVTNCAAIFMAQNAGSSGTLLIHDPGSVFNNAACGIQVGQAGAATVTVSNGGELDTLGSSFIAGSAGTSSSVTVTGAGSKWAFSGLLVGASGNGAVNVAAGGLVTQTACSTVTVGSGFNSVSAVNVGGAGSHWANGGCGFDLGTDGNGTLNVTSGAVVDGVGSLILGKNFNTSKGAITVSGVGSKLTSAADVEVGEFGVGTLTISGGGVLADATANLADLNGSSGTATVDGVGSAWNTSGALGIGRNGAGSLSITNGAVVTSASGWVSGSTDGGSLTVSGTGSKWTAATSLDLGERGTSTISITNGGVVADQTGVSADLTGAAPTITIDGAGSAWTSSSSLTLGGGFNSTLALSVTNGGLLSDSQGSLGQGSVLVSGTNSAWTNTSTLRVGASGPGVLTIAHQGTVNAPGGVILGQSSSSSGVLNIGGAVGKPADSPGTLNAPTIVLGTGNGSQGTLNFNHNSVSYLFSPVISGPGKVNVVSGLTIFNVDETYTGLTTISSGAILQIGNGPAAGSIVSDVADDGTLYFIRGGSFTYGGKVTGSGALTMFGAGGVLTLIGASTYTGATHVDAGGLVVNGSLGATAVTVGSVASLGGSGTIGGPVNVANSGILNGVAGQTLTMGDLTLASGAVVNVSLGAPSSTRLFKVNGALALDGTLNVTNAGAFGPGLYRLFDYTGALTDNGLNLGTLPSGVQSSSLQVQTSVAGQVNLVFAAGVATPFWNGAVTIADGTVHGGAGTWKLGPTNWTDASGANAGPWDGTSAIFAGGASGAVTVDNGAGQVGANFMQFAIDGYTIGGGALALTGATPTIRVGDGTSAGAFDNVTINAVLSGSNGLTKTDLGNLILAGANTYSGGTFINGGFVVASADANLGAAGGAIVFNGGGLAPSASFSTGRGLQIAGAGEVHAFSGASLTVNGALTGSGAFNKSGLGALVLAGGGSYSGALSVTGGRLQVDSLVSAGSVDVKSGASLSGSGGVNAPVTIENDGYLYGAAGQTLTTGALTLNQSSNISVSLGAPSTTRLFNVNGALTLDGNLNITGLGGFGQGLYRLFDYSGALTDNGLAIGTLPGGVQATSLSVQTAVAGQVNLVYAAPAATPFWNGGHTSPTGTISGGSGTWKVGPTNWTDAAGATSGAWDGTFGIFAGAAGTVTVDNSGGAVSATGLQFASNGYIVNGDTLTLTGATPTVRVGDGTAAGANDLATFQTVIAGTGGLIKTDLGGLDLQGVNTYSGGTTVLGGTVSITSDANLGAASGSVTLNGGGLAVGGTFVTTRAVAVTGPGEIWVDTNRSFTLQGAVSGNGALTKTGLGALDLTGVSSYAGQLKVAGGLALADGSMQGSVDVLANAHFSGVGSVAGVVTVENGSYLQGGAGNTLTMGGLVLSAGANISAVLGAPSTQTLFQVNGALTLDGTINVAGLSGFGPGLYRIINYTGALTDNGLVVGSVPAGVSASDAAIQTAVAGQVNLVVSAPTILFWNGAATSADGTIHGGTGTWKLGPTNWTDANGAVSAGWNSGFGVFAGAAGVVTLDGSAGGISANGLQFAVTGYTVGGAALTLSGAAPTLRVGDGTAAGAGYTATVNSVIAGTSGLTKTDLGTLVLGGANTFTGGLTVNGGFVSVGADSALGAAGGAVTLNGGGLQATASFATARNVAVGGPGEIRTASGTSLTINGGLSGAGALVKSGTGTLVLTGANAYTGAASVAAGTLRVDGTLAGTVAVQGGGRLQGVGQVGATTVASGGVVAAGDSIGTLTVNGGATFASGSTLEVELNAQGQADLVHVTGAATLAGGTVAALPAAGGGYSLGQRFTVLTADGGGTGAFGGVTGALNMPFLKLGLAYDAKHVFLDVVRNGATFCSVAQTANQCAAANGAESLGQGRAVYDSIANLGDAAQARGAFDALSGEIGASAKGVEIEDSRFIRDAANARLRGATGQDHGAWGQTFGSWGQASSDGDAAGLHRALGGFVLGGDLAPGQGWRLGALAGYGHAGLDVPARASTGGVDSYHLAVYGGADAGALAFRLGAAYAWHSVHTRRTVSYAGFADVLSGDYHARSGQVFGEAGYRWTQGATIVEPYAGLAHVMLHTDGFTEAGGAAALTSAASSVATTFTTLGVRASGKADWAGAGVSLHGGVAWRRAFGDVTPMSRFAFASGGAAFDIAGLPVARDAVTLDAGVDVAVSKRATLSVGYAGQVARNLGDHGAKATFTLAF